MPRVSSGNADANSGEAGNAEVDNACRRNDSDSRHVEVQIDRAVRVHVDAADAALGSMAESDRMRQISNRTACRQRATSRIRSGDKDGQGAIVVSRDGTQTEWSMALDFAVPEPQRKEMAEQRVAKLKSSSPSGRFSCRRTARWKPAIGIRRL